MMDRKEFIKTCGFSCLALAGFPLLLDSCTGTKYIQATASNNKLSIAKKDFFKENDTSKKARHSVIVKTEQLNYPIVVYRVSDTDYTALLLQCTHQSMELNVSGDLISCPAHGSEFNRGGEVTQGPAEHSLKRYNVTHDTENIYIHLA